MRKRPSSILSQEVRLAVYRLAGGRCHYCRCSLHEGGFQVDHKRCRHSGGSDALTNLVLSCVECNGAKGVRTYRSFLSLLQRKGLAWRDQQYELRTKLYKRRRIFSKAVKAPWHCKDPLILFAKEEMKLLAEAKKRKRFC